MTAAAARVLVDEIMPRIQAAVPKCVKKVGAEDDDELTQDGAAQAAMAIESCEARGQPIYASSIAYFTVQRLKSGRRANYAGRADVLSASTQLDGNAVVSSMDESLPCDDDGEGLTLHDQLAAPVEDPAQEAGRRIDWEELASTLSDREVAIVQSTISGGTLDDLARRFGISSPRINQIKKALGQRIKQSWGATAIADATRAPAWAATIFAGREQSRCRHERAALAEA